MTSNPVRPGPCHGSLLTVNLPFPGLLLIYFLEVMVFTFSVFEKNKQYTTLASSRILPLLLFFYRSDDQQPPSFCEMLLVKLQMSKMKVEIFFFFFRKIESSS